MLTNDTLSEPVNVCFQEFCLMLSILILFFNCFSDVITLYSCHFWIEFDCIKIIGLEHHQFNNECTVNCVMASKIKVHGILTNTNP